MHSRISRIRSLISELVVHASTADRGTESAALGGKEETCASSYAWVIPHTTGKNGIWRIGTGSAREAGFGMEMAVKPGASPSILDDFPCSG